MGRGERLLVFGWVSLAMWRIVSCDHDIAVIVFCRTFWVVLLFDDCVMMILAMSVEVAW
jgi:hypothetical protein